MSNLFLERGLTLAAGLLMKRFINWPFDFVLYPLAMVSLGDLWGGAVMVALSLLGNLVIIRAYDWSQTDWLAIEALKGFLEGGDEAYG